MTDPQTRIATQLLSGHLYRAKDLTANERSEDIRLALELAEELLRQRGSGVPTFENSPPRSDLSPAVTATKEQLIEREPLAALDILLANRRGRAAEPAEKPMRKGPTIH
ncbi:MAG: hypothetical protein E2581_23030 [Pseudomonas sp.]|uniref:hypothetical protein n=1 Tax=Pseudomonas sp. TaxID=306 RepID=UPI001D5C2A00|nr:hypothetical protein [Pseudomonas sp.]MPT01340.1 hypothetical protein [Pseudomonas sp.]